MWQKFNNLYIYTKNKARPSSNNIRAMDIEQFYIEKRSEIILFDFWDLQRQGMPLSNYSASDIQLSATLLIWTLPLSW